MLQYMRDMKNDAVVYGTLIGGIHNHVNHNKQKCKAWKFRVMRAGEEEIWDCLSDYWELHIYNMQSKWQVKYNTITYTGV